MAEGICPYGCDPSQLNNPEIEYFKPSPLLREDSRNALKKVCPFFDETGPLCCNDD